MARMPACSAQVGQHSRNCRQEDAQVRLRTAPGVLIARIYRVIDQQLAAAADDDHQLMRAGGATGAHPPS